MSGIYAIVNTVNGRKYIGCSAHVAKRLRSHLYELSKGTHENQLLQNAWKKHGAVAFSCQLVEQVEAGHLLEAEQRHIDTNAGGYNLCLCAGKPPSGNRAGQSLSESTKQLLRECNQGKKLSEETRRRMSVTRTKPAHLRKVYQPRIHTDGLTKGQRISLAKTGKKMSPEAIEINRRAHLGIRPSQSHRDKIAAAVRAAWAAKRLRGAL